MSITRDRGEVVFECDGPQCHETLETGERDFDAARQNLVSESWATRKLGTEWYHFCSAVCRAKFLTEANDA